ncbi:MAG: FtsX-like permease family protein, partial [Patescibacteria group bacterium]
MDNSLNIIKEVENYKTLDWYKTYRGQAAIILTFIGGFIGILLGALIAFIMSYFDIIQTSVSIFSVFLAFGVSAIIGIVFGYYPARRAAKLNPIDAL